MESLKAPAPCGLDGSRKRVTDRVRIAATTALRADGSCAESVLRRLMSGERVAQGELLPLWSHGPYRSEGIESALDWTR